MELYLPLSEAVLRRLISKIQSSFDSRAPRLESKDANNGRESEPQDVHVESLTCRDQWSICTVATVFAADVTRDGDTAAPMLRFW